MTQPPTSDRSRAVREHEAARFRRTLVRVMLVQVVSLALLWLLQSRYTP